MSSSVNAVLMIFAISLCIAPALAEAQSINIVPCSTGDTRPCGSGVGECEKGVTTCENGIWGECDGGVEPVEEDCSDGLDNDCNGLVDDCGFNTVSYMLIGAGLMLLVVALVLNKLGK